MKKYLYTLFVALFATMVFSLTSCSDKDDEPNGDNNETKINQLVLDGKTYSFEFQSSRIFMRYDKRNAFECNLRTTGAKEFSFTIYNWDSISDGYVYNVEDWNDEIGIWWDDAANDPDSSIEYNMLSGTIKIIKVDKDSKILTISFNHTVYGCERDNVSLSIDGTLSVNYN